MDQIGKFLGLVTHHGQPRAFLDDIPRHAMAQQADADETRRRLSLATAQESGAPSLNAR